MKFLSLIFVLLCVCLAQDPLGSSGNGPGGRHPDIPAEPDARMARSQRNALIKADHEKNLADAAALLKLAEELTANLEKEDPLVISIKSIKQTEDIQKLAKNIHGRLKRF